MYIQYVFRPCYNPSADGAALLANLSSPYVPRKGMRFLVLLLVPGSSVVAQAADLYACAGYVQLHRRGLFAAYLFELLDGSWARIDLERLWEPWLQ